MIDAAGRLPRKQFIATLGGATACIASFSQLLRAQAGNTRNGASIPVLTAKLSEMIPELLLETAIPGLSVALIHEAEVVWSRGFGVKSVETKEPVDADTVFEAASLSKPAFGMSRYSWSTPES